MQMDAKTTWWLNFLLVAIQGLSTIAWNTMGVDSKWIALITQVIGYASILLNFAIHGSVPGIAAVTMPGTSAPPVPIVVKKLIIFAVLVSSLLFVPGAHAQTKIKLTGAAVQGNPLLLIKNFTATDLQVALADANAQTPPDTAVAACYQALLNVINTPGVNPLPSGPGVFQALQKARDAKALLASLQSPSGPLATLNNACAPLVMDAQNTLVALGVTTGLVANPAGAATALAGLPAAVVAFLNLGLLK